MNRFKKAFWVGLGFIFLGIAYIGVVTPGIPWSTPSLLAAWCFAKGSEKWHNWITNHKLFGPFIQNWNTKRVYPSKVKWLMFIVMDISLVTLWFTTYNWKAVAGMGVFFALILLWASRYPGSVEEADSRVLAGKKIGWFK